MSSSNQDRSQNLSDQHLSKLQGLHFVITGGCGFVGSRVTKYLSDNGATCHVVDNMFTGKKEHVDLLKNVNVVEGDVRDEKLLRSLLPNCHGVVHCATVNIMAGQEDPMLDISVNAGGTQLISSLCTEFKNIQSMVYTSSASVYGDSTKLPTNEIDTLNPRSFYSVSKLAGEHYCRIAMNKGTPVSILRLSNVYGPHQWPDNIYCGVVSKIYNSISNDGVVRLYGSGQQTRDFTYIDDVVDAIVLASLQSEASGQIFNVASGVETQVDELARVIAKTINQNPKYLNITPRTIDNIDRRCLDVNKIGQLLGWSARTKLEDGLRNTIEWLERF